MNGGDKWEWPDGTPKTKAERAAEEKAETLDIPEPESTEAEQSDDESEEE